MQGENLVVQHAKGGVQLQFAAGSAHYLHCGAFYAGKLCCLNPHAYIILNMYINTLLNMCQICRVISCNCCLLSPLMSPKDRKRKVID